LPEYPGVETVLRFFDVRELAPHSK
jgi:hypothetical protein